MDGEQLGEEDDTPKLSEHAMAALIEFYAEQDAKEKTEQDSTVTENWVISISFVNPYNSINTVIQYIKLCIDGMWGI